MARRTVRFDRLPTQDKTVMAEVFDSFDAAKADDFSNSTKLDPGGNRHEWAVRGPE